MHGHIERLADMGAPVIFYPRMTWNLDEHASDNHYNCPVVAYYSELLRGNMDSLKKVTFLYPYLSLDSRGELAEGLWRELKPRYRDLVEHTRAQAEKRSRSPLGFMPFVTVGSLFIIAGIVLRSTV
jgi:predicted nucleotide-binding protein (sugar kinase/HSP70/actin superfamily)